MTFYEMMHLMAVVNAILASAGAGGWWYVTIDEWRKPAFGRGSALVTGGFSLLLTAMAAFLWGVWYSQLGAL